MVSGGSSAALTTENSVAVASAKSVPGASGVRLFGRVGITFRSLNEFAGANGDPTA